VIQQIGQNASKIKLYACRKGVGVRALHGITYAIGGYNGEHLKSIEVYTPSDGVWSFIYRNMELC